MKHGFSQEELNSMVERVMDDSTFYALVAFRGSIAHETYVPSTDPDSIDDIDLIGFTIPDKEYYLGIREWGSRGTKEVKDGPLDAVFYEARKIVSLLAKGNPNVLSLLFLEDDYILKSSEAYSLLREKRDVFLSRDLYHPFIGYAYGQFQRMERFKFEGYMGEKRKALVEKVGHDAKNASHGMRILRMGKELLETGTLNVHRGDIDADELIAIKHGEWHIEEVKAEADRLFRECSAAKENSPLPDSVDMDEVNRVCVEVVELGMWR